MSCTADCADDVMHRSLSALLCRPHCAFFKPWKTETERCAGYEFFQTRGREGLSDLGRLAPLVASRAGLSHDPLLAERVCAACAFREEDCDFRDPKGPADARPCGGLIAADALLSMGWLKSADLDPRRWAEDAKIPG